MLTDRHMCPVIYVCTGKHRTMSLIPQKTARHCSFARIPSATYVLLEYYAVLALT